MFGPSFILPVSLLALDEHLSADGHDHEAGSEKICIDFDNLAFPALNFNIVFPFGVYYIQLVNIL